MNVVIAVAVVCLFVLVAVDWAWNAAWRAHVQQLFREEAEIAQRLCDDAWAWYETAQARHDRDQTERSRAIMEKAGANYRRQARYLDDCRKAAIEVGVEC